jgi:Sap, sulfolipid-1-addressing protein
MTLEVLALGVISGLRPATSQAAVVALLRTPDPRRRLLFFVVAGLTVSVALGLLCVLAFHGARVDLGGSTFTAVFDLVAGVAALAFAVGYRQGRVSVPRRQPRGGRSAGPSARLAQRLRNPSVATAAAAGVVTHIPGLIYLVALNAIAAGSPPAATATADVGLYNLLWFAVPLAALALAVLRPGRAAGYLDRATRWGRQHEQRVVTATFVLLGVYLTIKGVVSLS